MNILVLNAGSSTLKFRLFRMEGNRPLTEPEEVTAGGQVDRIGKPDARLTVTAGPEARADAKSVKVGTIREAAREVIRHLTAVGTGDGQSPVIDAVGHRIVHGGPTFFEPALITDEIFAELQALTELAPLHNPAGLAGIEAVRSAMPAARNIAVFDTAFHHNLPKTAANYAIPADLAGKFHLRRYGFHGISYRYVVERLMAHLRGPAPGMRILVCHLGNGASACAVRDGVSVDTSMGFTPLEGLIMGTRCGDIDAGLVLHLLRHGQMSIEKVDELLNRKCGLLGLSGISGDVRDLEKAVSAGDAAAELALESFAYRVRKYIGAYAAALGGVDALVFTAGIGEHSASMRARICGALEFLGLNLDADRNSAAAGHDPVEIGATSAPGVWIVPTDEERQIAREVYALLG